MSIIGNIEADRRKNRVKIAVLLNYLSNFWRSLEILLINCKVELSLGWTENCILSGGENIIDARAVANAGTAVTFKITDAWLYVPIGALSAEHNAKLSKLLSDGFERSIYWNIYNVQNSAVNSHQKYFLLRLEIKNYNIEMDGRNFYDQPIIYCILPISKTITN